MNRYTLRQLEYLVACVDQRSIAKAATILNVSQPTISVAISKLEQQFGVQLLLRHHSQGVSPTSSATKILTLARSLLAQATDLQRAAMLAGTDVAGDLRIGSFSTLAPLVLPGLIQSYSAQYPDVTLHIEEGTEDDLLAKIYAGTLDAAVLYDVALPSIKKFADFHFIDWSVAILEQRPGMVIPLHQDTYYRFKEDNGIISEEVVRYNVFLDDWRPGHYMEADDKPIVNWKMGNYIRLTSDIPHRTANVGTAWKYTCQVTGVEK